MNKVNKIGILTSGGDAPGMNAAIRAIVRTSAYHNIPVIGIKRGFRGMIDGDFIELKPRDVGNIIQRGGTVLLTARSEEFKTPAGFQKALQSMHNDNIDSVIIIGGDGSMHGAAELEKHGVKTIGIPATIDNDIWGSEVCIGVDTCLNTIINAVDKLRDTALSHERIFVVEVMGNSSGYLACEAGISAGAESIIVPEIKWSIEEIVTRIKRGYEQGKRSHIILVSEGAAKANDIAEDIINASGMEVRITVLGHVQRGGTPTVNDRNLGTKLGFEAVNALLNNQSGHMVGINKGQISLTPLNEVKTFTRIDKKLLHAMQNILSI